jgi:phytoene synthase
MAESTGATLATDLRGHDHDRFQMTLFAPQHAHAALFALYEFNFEIARIREVTREPLLGRMRLQWWRDALSEIYAGGVPRRHAVVQPLTEAIRDHGLSRDYFDALLDARELDIEDEPPASLTALRTYAEASSGNLVLLALEILGIRDPQAIEAGRAVGTAYALTGLLAALPFHARMRRVYLPQESIARHQIDLQRSLFELKPSPALAAAVKEVSALAKEALEQGRSLRQHVVRKARPALLPAILAERRLKLLAHLDYDAFDPRWAIPDPRQSWRLAWASMRGRY